MPIAKKLLLAFITASLVGTVLFGYITYHSVKTSNLEKDLLHLNAFVIEMGSLLQGIENPDTIRQSIQQHQSDSGHYFIVADSQGSVTYNRTALSHVTDEALRPLLNTRALSGELNTSEKAYIWAKTRLPTNSAQLLLLSERPRDQFSDFITSLGMPFLVAGLILLWASIWAALILASLFKRVDQQRRELEYQTLHDPLTGLANRTYLIEQIEKITTSELADNEALALIVIDINRFKEINDTLGHYIGDSLLCEIANRLKKILRESDTPIRLDSDEFAILVTGKQNDIVASVANRILDAINQGFEVNDHELYLGGSLGVAFYPEHALDAITLLQHAELAMYAAKRTGTSYTIYDSTHNTNSIEQLKLVNDLRTDIGTDNLQLYYQPKVDITNGNILSVEALARWHHPEFGNIPTSRFIHIAENTGLITPLTYWVLETAIKHAATLGDRVPNIAINLSTWNLQDTRIVEHIQKLIDDNHIAASRLTLEITETAMMVNHKRALATLHKFSELGLRLAVDDFGTGYSSLAYLRGLPLNEVKIDKSFIKTIGTDSNDSSLVRAIIDLAHDLELDVVAEGVEKAETLELLKSLGCDIAQGNFIAPPMPYAELASWLETPLSQERPLLA